MLREAGSGLPRLSEILDIAPPEAGVKREVLTHLSASISQINLAGALAEVRQYYQGEVLLGADLLVIE